MTFHNLMSLCYRSTNILVKTALSSASSDRNKWETVGSSETLVPINHTTWHHITGGCISYMTSTREICGGQSGTRTDFSPSISAFPLSIYHSKNAPYSSSYIFGSCQKGNGQSLETCK
jgi:hypothetical protein